MSVHAQVEGVGTLEFPDGTDPSVVQATVKKVIASRGAPAAPKPAEPYRSSNALEHADIAASVVTGGVGSLAGGLVKAGGYANPATAHPPGPEIGDANQAGA